MISCSNIFEGTDVYKFASKEEEDAWRDTHGTEHDPNPADHTVYCGYDTKGDTSTVYSVGLEISQNDDGTISSVTLGISNDDNEFGYVSTIELIELESYNSNTNDEPSEDKDE